MCHKTKPDIQTFIKMIEFSFKWSEKGWYAVKQPANQQTKKKQTNKLMLTYTHTEDTLAPTCIYIHIRNISTQTYLERHARPSTHTHYCTKMCVPRVRRAYSITHVLVPFLLLFETRMLRWKVSHVRGRKLVSLFLYILSSYICEMCHKYKIKFGGSTCSSQVISRTKQKQNLNNYKIKVYYSVRICTKELTMLLLSLLLPISPLV